MSWRRELAKLGALFRRSKPGDDRAEEIRAHLAMEEQENLESGMAPEEAHYAALRRFGNVVLAQERSREMWGWTWAETLWQDLRYGLRQLRRGPGFTAVAVLTLALGIGANTAIFSVVEAVLLRPLPYGNPSQLALLADAQEPQDGGLLFRDFETCKSQTKSFEDLAIYYRDSGYSRVTLTAAAEPESVQGAFVSANFFPLMGVSPLLGRAFTPEEVTRRERIVLLSHGLWLRRFGGSPEAIGKTLQIDGMNSQVIGVMPRLFSFPPEISSSGRRLPRTLLGETPRSPRTSTLDTRGSSTKDGKWLADSSVAPAFSRRRQRWTPSSRELIAPSRTRTEGRASGSFPCV
jgi:hypothetical protein